MAKDGKPIIDFEEMEAAFRRAAHVAIYGSREERSGRFLSRSADHGCRDEPIGKDAEAGKLDELIDERGDSNK